MHAAARDDEGTGFGAFLHHRGQDVLRLGYLLTGSQKTARTLAVQALADLGGRWPAMLREHHDPTTAVRVLTSQHFLREPPADPETPAEDGDEIASGWQELQNRPPAERAGLIMQHWAELDNDALDQALAVPRQTRSAVRKRLLLLNRIGESLGRFLEPRDSPVLIDLETHRPGAGERLTGWFLQDVFRYAERDAPLPDAEFVAEVEAQALVRQRQARRRQRVTSSAVAAAVVMVVGAGSLVRQDPPPPPPPSPAAGGAAVAASLTWADVWPGSSVTRFVAELRDGRAYLPLRFIDKRTAVASTYPSSGTPQLLLVDVLHRTARVLGTIAGPLDRVQTATDGFHVGWMTPGGAGLAGGQLWVADIKGGPSRMVANVPPLQLRESRPSLGMGTGRIYLVRARGSENRSVEISSVRITGGTLQHEMTLPGFLPIGWPWFSTVATSSRQQVRIRNALTGEEREGRLPRGSTLGVCEGIWCVGTLQRGGPTRPGEVLVGLLDGTHRSRLVPSHPQIGPPPVLAGRFVLTRGVDGATYLYDLRQDRQVRLSGSVRQVVPSGRLLGWSVQGIRGTRWRIADLAPLP